jgi:NADP-dependent 3-hydroxy acid dehydrogenase YdfG
MRRRPLEEQTIVITGGSSGIGLTTARLAAARGANVVIAARSGEVLDQVAARISGQVLAVEADVADAAAVQAVAAQAVSRFGVIDTWVNDAGVDVWARLVDIDEADARALFDTNFWGVVNGSLAAIPHLRERGGSLINIGSVESDRAFPLQGMYAATKHAVQAYSDALRMELERSGEPISVTLIKPGSVGTPLPDHAKTYLDRGPRLPKPLYHPEEVAKAILSASERPQREIYVGGQARLFASLGRLAPRLLDRFSERWLIEPQLAEAPATRADNLHQGRAEGHEVGRTAGRLSRSLYTRAVLQRWRVRVILATTMAAAGMGLARRRGSSAS